MSLKQWITVANLCEHFALNLCVTELIMNMYGQDINLCQNEKKKYICPLSLQSKTSNNYS